MESLHYLLMKAHTNVNRWILAQASSLGLSPGQPKILECLMACGECNQKSLATYCEIEQATAGGILMRMERDGLVQRAQRSGNRRDLFVSLTPRGRELADRMQSIFQEADARAASGLSPEETACLLTLLERVCASVSDQRKEP